MIQSLQNFRLVLALLSVFTLLFMQSAYSRQAGVLPDYSTRYDPARDPFQDGRDALKLAKETGRLVMIEVGGEWCAWCHLFDNAIKKDLQLYELLYGNFVVLKVSVDDENDNREFLKTFPETNGYPHVFITDANGTVVHSSDLTHLVQNGKFVKQKIIDFLGYFINKYNKKT